VLYLRVLTLSVLWIVSLAGRSVQAAPSSQFLPGPEGFRHMAGVWRGPDYVLGINADGNATLQWFDNAGATIFFYGMTRSGQTAFGLVQSSTDAARISQGDQVSLYVPVRYSQGEAPLVPSQFMVTWPGGTVRWENTVCYQGQNLTLSRYPC
jgi:hypothetical protein